MELKRNKIMVHVCGGAAMSCVEKSLKPLLQLGDGFAEISFSYIDASRNNYDNIEHNGPFFLLQRKSNAANEIVGSGGERSTNATDIAANIGEYLDSLKITTKKAGEFHVVIASGSGGTGNVIQFMLVKELLKKDIPVVAYMIGDSSDMLKNSNTKNSLASLSNMVTKANKTLLLYFINNSSMGASITENENMANEKIRNSLAVLATFLSGQNESIDPMDMDVFINQHNYKTTQIQPGIYIIVFQTGSDFKLPKSSVPTIARTLAIGNEDVAFDVKVLHHKVGRIICEDAIATFQGKSPIHMFATSGTLNDEIKKLTEVHSMFVDLQNKMTNAMYKPTEQAVEDEDTGLIL